MTKEQALQIIEQVCSQYRGSLEEHQNIQAALSLLKKELDEEEIDEATEPKSK